MNEIIEGNKLIAEFMGDFRKVYTPQKGYTLGNAMLDTLKYHSSWDWLMPVVEKIDYNLVMPNGDYFQTSIGKHKSSIFRKDKLANPYLSEEISVCGETKLESTWLSVVEFIKWYNNQIK